MLTTTHITPMVVNPRGPMRPRPRTMRVKEEKLEDICVLGPFILFYYDNWYFITSVKLKMSEYE